MNGKENNQLIAEFMGGTLSSVPNLINLSQTRGDANIHSVKGSEMLPNGTYSVHRLNELKYHSSWDWLMPVVEKCFVKQEEVSDDLSFKLNDALLETNIESLYKAVVEFIKQHNNQ